MNYFFRQLVSYTLDIFDFYENPAILNSSGENIRAQFVDRLRVFGIELDDLRKIVFNSDHGSNVIKVFFHAYNIFYTRYFRPWKFLIPSFAFVISSMSSLND